MHLDFTEGPVDGEFYCIFTVENWYIFGEVEIDQFVDCLIFDNGEAVDHVYGDH